jgi:hypothetical protein
MESSLNSAFEVAAKLPPNQQELFAAFLLAELKDEEEWKVSFHKSRNSLANLAKEARAEYREGQCEPLEDLLS